MATYALTFATRAAFDTSLASGDIYNLMQGVTSSKPSVAITATITESGETFACGTNVMVDIKSVGPGDYVMYDSTNAKLFGIASKWIDNNYPYQPTQHIMIFKAGVLPARYVICGTVIKRFGNRIRVAGVSNTSLPWSSTNQSDYQWNVPALTTSTNVLKKSRTTTTTANTNGWCSFPSSRYQEAYFVNGQATYLPITRDTWNAAVAAGQATVTQNSKTATLADYDYSYDKWLAYNFAPLWPAASGIYADKDGIGNTKKIVTEFVANHGKSLTSVDYAAGYCYNYSVNAPGLGKHQWFLGTLKDIGEAITLIHTLLVPVSWGSSLFWSSCIYNSSTAAWLMRAPGYTYYTNKYSAPFNTNEITSEHWALMENNGAVFLPAAGSRQVGGNSESHGCYWSTSSFFSASFSYRVFFDDSALVMDCIDRFVGQSVRLVAPVEN